METKFDIGDVVWCLFDDNVSRMFVREIFISKDSQSQTITYSGDEVTHQDSKMMKFSGRKVGKDESRVFKNKQELIDNL